MPKSRKPQEPGETRPRKKRRWRKRLLVIGGLLLVFGIVAEGPGARWLIRKAVRGQLAKQGAAGDLVVRGHLVTGFTLSEADFAGEGRVKRVRIEEVTLRYRLWKLLGKKVDLLRARGLELHLVLGPKSDEEKPPLDLDKLGKTIRMVRGLVVPVEIDVEGVSVVLDKEDGGSMEFSVGALKHAPESGEFEVRGFSSDILGEGGLPKQDLALDWQVGGLALGGAVIFPNLEVGSLLAKHSEGGALGAEGTLKLGGCTMDLEVDQDGSAKVQLIDGPLDLSRLNLPYDLKFGGRIETLSVEIREALVSPNAWTADVKFAARDLDWGTGTLGEITAGMVLDARQLTAEVEVGPHLKLTARGPHVDLVGKNPGEWVEGDEISYTLRVPSLHGALGVALSAGGGPVPDLKRIPEGAFQLDGKVVLGGERGVSAASGQWVLSGLVLGESPLRDIEGEVALKDGAVEATVSLHDAPPEESVILAARLDLESMSYDGSAAIRFPDTAWLRPLVPLEGENWKPTGPLVMRWKGTGALRDGTHRGEATLEKAAVSAPKNGMIEASLAAGYDWPGTVTVSSLTIRNGEVRLEGALALENDRVEIKNVRIHDGTGELAHLGGSIPIPAKGANLGDYFKSGDPLDLEIRADDLRLSRLADLAAVTLPPGYAATLSADLKVSGKVGQPLINGDLAAREIRLSGGKGLADLSVAVAFKTAAERLAATARISDPKADLAVLDASLPFDLEKILGDPKHVLNLPIKTKLAINAFRLKRLDGLAPGLAGLTGQVDANLEITGTINEPSVTGKLALKDFRRSASGNLPVIAASIDLAMEGRTLKATGTVSEPGGEILALRGSVPLEVGEGLKNPEHFKTLPLEAGITIKDFDLKRLVFLTPQAARAVGRVNVDMKAAGTLRKPVLSGGAAVIVDRFPLEGTPFREITNTKLLVRLEGQEIFVDPSPIMVAGGKLTLSGKIGEIGGGDPLLDIQLQARQALLWRDQNLTSRGDGDFRLQGRWSKAALSGELRIVESLFYKEIELIPTRVPVTAVAKPQLPSFDDAGATRITAVPAPFADWSLNLRVVTQDPILVRGNRTKGEVHVKIAVGGTASAPRPSGKVTLKDIEVALPFSRLRVPTGSLVLRPNHPFDPVLDIRGLSTVGSYQTRLYLYGPLSHPKYSLNSDPPLPENEVLSLLASGSTTDSLQDRELAQGKAFQLLIDELRQRMEKPGGNAAIAHLLSGLDNVELNMGDNDPFSGHRRTSATMRLSDHWLISAAFDRQGRTRGTVIYSLRFR